MVEMCGRASQRTLSCGLLGSMGHYAAEEHAYQPNPTVQEAARWIGSNLGCYVLGSSKNLVERKGCYYGIVTYALFLLRQKQRRSFLQAQHCFQRAGYANAV